ncbi:low temperature requirement protein A [Pelagerythrobacter marensis]|uniref:Low temperature requirement protein A n=1 Tax=Pelagerythrobacter marensis TaxID=543877 RepID=A0ABZ2CZH9_9SPHN
MAEIGRPTVAARPMVPRDPGEPGRAATPLELLFDLVSVIAIAAAAAGLHHAIAGNHPIDGVLRFGAAFFAIWWAWMNYTWFASAYDNNDTLFRLLTMTIMGGALVLAAGVEPLFATLDIRLTVAGYVIMRVPMAVLWLRAARSDPARRRTNLRYCVGILVAQTYWIIVSVIASGSASYLAPMLIAGILLELAVPVFAERSSETPWHRHHIVERYGLLNIIVLGEILLAAVIAIRTATEGTFDVRQIHIAISALAITFSMWWLYFSDEDHLPTQDLGRALQWGYGHVFIFASGAAVGAGFAVLVDILAGKAHVDVRTGDLAVAIPLAIYVLGLWWVRDRFLLPRRTVWILPVLAAALIIMPLIVPALELIAIGIAAIALIRTLLCRRGQGALVK